MLIPIGLPIILRIRYLQIADGLFGGQITSMNVKRTVPMIFGSAAVLEEFPESLLIRWILTSGVTATCQAMLLL